MSRVVRLLGFLLVAAWSGDEFQQSGGSAGSSPGGAGGSTAGAGGASPLAPCTAGKVEACACPGSDATGTQTCDLSGVFGACVGCPSGQGGEAGQGGQPGGAGGQGGAGASAGGESGAAGAGQAGSAQAGAGQGGKAGSGAGASGAGASGAGASGASGAGASGAGQGGAGASAAGAGGAGAGGEGGAGSGGEAGGAGQGGGGNGGGGDAGKAGSGGASPCGNGKIDPEELCDGADLGGESCATLVKAGTGKLVCKANCTFDTSGCSSTTGECGDGKLNQPTEECDDGNNDDGDGCNKSCKVVCLAGEEKFGTHCYLDSSYESSGYQTWDNAQEICEQEGGYLIAIDSQEELLLAVTLAKSNTNAKGDRWIGLKDKFSNNKFSSWSSGDAVTITSWAPTEPSNVAGEDCVEMDYTNGLWYTQDCSATRYFICEYPPPVLSP